MRALLITAFGVLFVSACGADDSGEDPAGLFQELVSVENTAAGLSCNCDREMFSSVAECTAARTPNAEERDCKREEYGALADQGAAVMACAADAQRTWVECIEAYGCRDFSACGTARNTDLAACGADESAIRARCYFIDCPTGEAIPSTARCDGARDCADGSDESSCFAGGS